MRRIAVGSDHAGFALKGAVSDHLTALGHEVIDVGCHDDQRCDYPDFGAAVGRTVTGGEADLGVAVCGSGLGIAIAANKVPGVRAVTVTNSTAARLSREHNDANVMCLGERLIGIQVALDAVDAFLAAPFSGGRHQDRVAKIDDLLPSDGDE